MESLGTSLLSTSKIEVGHFGAVCYFFVNMLFFAYLLLLTCRLMLVEVFITVVMYWSQQPGRQGQRIDTRNPGRQSQTEARKWDRVLRKGGN